MEFIPAIDLLDGSVVRLHKGDYGAVTVYAEDAVAQARVFAEDGAKRLHVVDLEGARTGSPAHIATVEAILADTSLEVQIGGGIRDRAAAERWLEAGASRVVLGTVAAREPALAEALCRDYPGKVVIAIDARGERVAVDGWQVEVERTVRELAASADGWGAASILYTDIDRDGTGAGPALERTSALQDAVSAEVIASGGIGSLAHVQQLAASGVRAAVCGRALYEHEFTVAEAIAASGAPDAR